VVSTLYHPGRSIVGFHWLKRHLLGLLLPKFLEDPAEGTREGRVDSDEIPGGRLQEVQAHREHDQVEHSVSELISQGGITGEFGQAEHQVEVERHRQLIDHSDSVICCAIHRLVGEEEPLEGH
jgi:hypothetical protein